MFSVRLINGEESTMSLQELKGFCWDMGVDFSRVQEVIDKDTEFGGMTVKTAAWPVEWAILLLLTLFFANSPVK